MGTLVLSSSMIAREGVRCFPEPKFAHDAQKKLAKAKKKAYTVNVIAGASWPASGYQMLSSRWRAIVYGGQHVS
jgi:hypothetical protein